MRLPGSDDVFADAIRRGRVVLGQATGGDTGAPAGGSSDLEKTRFAKMGDDPLFPMRSPASRWSQPAAAGGKARPGSACSPHVPEGDGVAASPS